MKISQKEGEQICKLYDLGRLESINILEGGMMNHNFILKTRKGNFVLRILRKKLDENYKKFKEAQFELLNTLKQKKYDYHIPIPLVNKNNETISKVGKNHAWIYRFISGNKFEKLNDAQAKEIAKALALYHKYSEKMNLKIKNRDPSDFKWIREDYDKMKKIEIKTELDKLMLEKIELFEMLLSKVEKTKFEGKFSPMHGDFHQNNLIFEGDKLVGVIDFDNLSMTLKGVDLAISMKSVCSVDGYLNRERFDLFLREYKKYNTLSKKEINQIIPLIIRNYCIIFRWAYHGEMKDEKNRMFLLKNVIKRANKLKEGGWIK